MGQAGAGFAQGFTSTLAQGMQLIEQTRAREEELGLRKKLVSAQLEEHKAKTELATRALTAGTSLQRQLLAGTPSGDMEQGLTTGEAPAGTKPSEKNRLAAMIAGLGTPEAVVQAAQMARAPEPTTLEGLQKLLIGVGGGGQPSMPGPTAPAAPGVEGAAPPGNAPGPVTGFVPSISINKDGSLSLTLQGQRTNFQVNTVTLNDPKTGKALMFERVFDPISGAAVAMRPLGEAPPPEALQRLGQAATALGFAPGTPGHGFAVGRLAIISGLPAEVQGEAMAQFETWAQQVTRTGGPPAATGARPAAPTLSSAREAVTAREIAKEQREPATTQAKKEAEKRVEVEPSYVLLDRLETLLPQIDLPKTARERVTASGRLQLGYTTQENKSLVLFQSLKEGLVAAFARLVEKGTMTDQDIARARALLPSVLPGVLPPTLPDTEEVALGKLKQLRGFLDELTKRAPPAVKPLMPAAMAPAAPTVTRPSITIPRGFQRVAP